MHLIHTPAGWTYPDLGPCPCGESVAIVGWAFCRCVGASGGGHPSWRCRGCAGVRTLGCEGAIAVSNDYGGRAGRAQRNASTLPQEIGGA